MESSHNYFSLVFLALSNQTNSLVKVALHRRFGSGTSLHTFLCMCVFTLTIEFYGPEIMIETFW